MNKIYSIEVSGLTKFDIPTSQLKLLKKAIENYEILLFNKYTFNKYNLKRDEKFRPYYYDEYLGEIINSDDLVQEVAALDDFLSILDSANIK